MKNILILSNSAPNYHNFFNQIAMRFKKDGSNVIIAVDSKYSRKQNRLDSLGLTIYEFSDYFKKHKINNEVLNKYSKYNLNAALLPDHERSAIYGIWGNELKEDFYTKIKSSLLCFFEDIIITNNIHVIIHENISNSFSYFAYFAGNLNGANYIGLGASRLPGRFTINQHPMEDNQLQSTFEDLNSGKITPKIEIKEWALEYLRNIENVVPDYMRSNGLDNTSITKKYFNTKTIKKIIKLFPYALNKRQDFILIGNPLITHINLAIRNIQRSLKLLFLKKKYDNIDYSEKYFLYPLHFHPEASTSILAGPYINEYETIRNIAFNLPEGYKLYVKDHISAWGTPSLSFYRSLKDLPNIKVLAPQEQTKELIKKSVAVITLTSTVGYEALMLKKNTFLIGNVFYHFHKGVIPLKEPATIWRTLKDSVDKTPNWDDTYNINFVIAYYLHSLEGNLILNLTGCAAKQKANEIYVKIKQLDFKV